MKNILLFICYPIALIINKDLRKYQKNKIKYWAMDNNYFQNEFKSISNIFLISISIYIFLFFGLAFILKSVMFVVNGVDESLSKAHYEIHNKNFIDATNKESFTNANIVVEKETVEINEQEYKDNKNDINVKDDIKETESEISLLLKNQREKN